QQIHWWLPHDSLFDEPAAALSQLGALPAGDHAGVDARRCAAEPHDLCCRGDARRPLRQCVAGPVAVPGRARRLCRGVYLVWPAQLPPPDMTARSVVTGITALPARGDRHMEEETIKLEQFLKLA